MMGRMIHRWNYEELRLLGDFYAEKAEIGNPLHLGKNMNGTNHNVL